MGESREVINLKREELKKELARPVEAQNKDKIKRLKESIDRHRVWEKDKNEKQRRVSKAKRIKNRKISYSRG